MFDVPPVLPNIIAKNRPVFKARFRRCRTRKESGAFLEKRRGSRAAISHGTEEGKGQGGKKSGFPAENPAVLDL